MRGGVLLLLLCTGCPNVDKAANQLADAYCARARSCCMQSEIDAFIEDHKTTAFIGPQDNSCEGAAENVFVGQLKPSDDAEKEGRVIYSQEAADACAAAIASASCETLKQRKPTTFLACDGIFVPVVEPGGACRADSDCRAGYCEGGSKDVLGICKAYAPMGQVCQADNVCGPEGVCKSTLPANQCAPLKVDGESCSTHSQCASGGCKAPMPNGSRVCGPRGGPGTTCFLQTGCNLVGGEALVATGLPVVLMMLGLRLGRRRRARA